ncbi:LysR family transcriptional regulator [Gordonia rubripertincta]|uniref:LysR family transcriptional regulator n=1 Tax=Gordonia rubripertincta TaxID=36822 RepID=UPI000B8D31C9|nr:LysR family transcriptional regulator [Gordonia rubripertincta]ASR01699.1 HTH-type transcriptional regulator GltC [Gordonia rubripertincta]
MLDLRRMMLLCDLADLGTVTAVADRRSITSSAVSQQLRVLEEEAGAVLFRREGRTLGLTRSGTVLVDYARRVLGAVDEAMSAVAAVEDRVAGQLSVASFNMGVSLLAAPMVQRLGLDAPEVHVQVHQQNRGASLRALRQGEIDLAIVCSYSFTGHEPLSGLSSMDLFDEPLVLMAPPSLHPLVRAAGLAALADQPWIGGAQKSGLGVALMRAGEREGFIPHVKHRLIGARNICELAGTGVGPAIVPALSIPAEFDDYVVDDIEIESRTVSAVVRTGRQRDPATAAALQALQEIADEVAGIRAEPVGAAS